MTKRCWAKCVSCCQSKVANLLRESEANINLDWELGEYGFDSVNLTGFRNDLNRAHGISLAPTVFFEYTTLAAFAEHLVDQYHETFAASLLPKGTETAQPRAAEVTEVAAKVETPSTELARNRHKPQRHSSSGWRKNCDHTAAGI